MSSYLDYLVDNNSLLIRYEQGQSMATKDHGVIKYCDIAVSYGKSKSRLQAIFYGELLIWPFNKGIMPHVKNDHIKLGKVGKNSIDMLRKTLGNNDIEVILMQFYGQ
ncbi:6644_t:CDS:2 [Entrophospora sp. SA101]|nr:6644_t:CDS:2 [Entrophospora sp. SA101]